jgi:hypothetical protein
MVDGILASVDIVEQAPVDEINRQETAKRRVVGTGPNL